MNTQVGTMARTGDICPETGIWEVQDCASITFILNEGSVIPNYKGNNVMWKLVDYVPLE